MGQEKNDKNAHISTVNFAVLPSLSDTASLSSSPIYSGSSTHPSSESSTLCSLSSSMKSMYLMLQKTNTALTGHHIFADLMPKQTQQELTEFSPFIRRKFVLKPVSVWLWFSKTTKVEFVDRGPRSPGGVSKNTSNECHVLLKWLVCGVTERWI